ncbi:hypothetical protein Tco_0846670 [Tanacetum coccineum]
MSSPNHLTSDIEDAFSSNFLDYIPASPDYFPASPGNTSSESSNHFRISDLEMTLEDIQDRHQLYMKNLMGHTSTSTSEAPAMTQAAIKKLVADSVATALEAQAATMANTNNPNSGLRKTHIESVFSHSNCAEKNKVKFAIITLTEEALFLWNSFAKSIGIEKAYKITWSEFKRLLIKKYYPQTEIKKMEEAITMTKKLIKQVSDLQQGRSSDQEL